MTEVYPGLDISDKTTHLAVSAPGLNRLFADRTLLDNENQWP
ncbi:hypothetical protein [Asticcacaulis biprosthecium]|nr:hypothetical protein [Asticcacaulis biprosthecium]